MTQDQYKTLLVKELNASDFQADIDEVWSLWWVRDGGEPDETLKELKLRRAMLQLLQGKYRTRYNTTQGRNKVEAFQQFQAIERMLSTVEGQITAREPASAGVGTLRSTKRKQTIGKGDSCGTVIPRNTSGRRY